MTETTPAMTDHFDIRTHNGCITMLNPATGQHRTLRIRTEKKDSKFAPGKRILSLLTGPDNTRNYTQFAFIEPNGTIRLWRRFRTGHWGTLADMLTRPTHWATTKQVEYDIEGTCIRCNRKLTVPESIRSGIGPVCAGRE